MSAVASLVAAACLAVNPHLDYIVAGDLAAVVPGLESAAPDTPVAPAPGPGVRRVFHAAEIERIAAKLGKTVTAPETVCFERAVAPLNAPAIQSAMHREAPEARITLLDYSRSPAPEGELEFPVSGLRQTASGGVWNGFVRYGANHRFMLWAKVRVSVTATRVMANEDLMPGRPVTSAQLHLETRDDFLSGNTWATSIEEIAGRVPRRRIAAGSALETAWFEVPRDVSRGDRLRVDVWSGAAHLELEATAEASGSAGQMIPVLNPDSKRRFQARVDGPGRASVRKDAP